MVVVASPERFRRRRRQRHRRGNPYERHARSAAAGKKAQPVADFVNGMSEVCIKIMHMIITIAPFGVFGLITPVVARCV